MHHTQLLDDEGRASLTTAVMMSHHAMRRDLALFARMLHAHSDDLPRNALCEEWRLFTEKLHGHHHGEDIDIFPQVLALRPDLANVIAQLTVEHTHIDPLLDRGGAAFASLPETRSDALDVVRDVSALLRTHLSTEEELVLPALRDARAFPLPANDEELGAFADGFAWTMFGIAPSVVSAVEKMLPAVLVAKLPAARAAYAKRRDALWGSSGAGASTTSTPDWLAR